MSSEGDFQQRRVSVPMLGIYEGKHSGDGHFSHGGKREANHIILFNISQILQLNFKVLTAVATRGSQVGVLVTDTSQQQQGTFW